MALRSVPITPGSGDNVSFDGEVQRVKLTFGPDGTQGDVESANPLPISIADPVDAGLPADVTLSDALANPTVPALGAYLLGYNSGSGQWVRVPCDVSTGLEVRISGSAAGVFAPIYEDGLAAGTLEGYAAIGTDGTTPRVLKTNASGHLSINDGGNSLTVDAPVGTPVNVQIGDGVDTALVTSSGLQVEVRGPVTVDQPNTASPVSIGGRASAAAPTAVSADGDLVHAWHLLNGAAACVLTAAGALIGGDATNGLDVDVTRVSGTVTVDSELPAAAALADNMANPTAPAVAAHLMLFDGSTHDRAPGNSTDGALVNLGANNDVTVTSGTISISPTAASGGLTMHKTISAASTNATNVKGSAGRVYSIHASNVNASARYLKLYNKATAPTVGSDTPVHTFIIPGNTAGAGFIFNTEQGLGFSLGIGFALTAGIADSDTANVSANEHAVNIGYL